MGRKFNRPDLKYSTIDRLPVSAALFMSIRYEMTRSGSPSSNIASTGCQFSKSMSIAFKPDVSTPQKMGKPSCMSAGRSAEQKFVTNCINGLSRKLKVMRQSGNPSKINVFYVAKIWCESTYFRYIFATLPFEFQLHPQNAPLTSTLTIG